MRLRWNILLLGGCLFFTGFAMWYNALPMTDDNPFNDSLLPLFLILWCLIGIPYFVTPLLMRLKSAHIDGNGLCDTLGSALPLATIDAIPLTDEKGMVKTQGGQPIIVYPKYNIYNLGSAEAFNLKIRGGGWSGIGVFPHDQCDRLGASVQVEVADAETFRTEEEKRKIPPHVLRRIKHEYKIRGWGWDDEFPIVWGEVPVEDERTNISSPNWSARCEMLEEKAKTWEKIARNWETQLLNLQKTLPEQHQPEQKMLQIMKPDGEGRE